MKRVLLVVLGLVLAVLPAASAPAQSGQPTVPRQETPPGMPTIARMYVLNQGRDQAVPVVVQSGSDALSVAVVGVPTVTLGPASTVGTHAARQRWEYRRVSVPAGDDVTDALNEAGGEGWEAVAVVPGLTAGSLQVVFKRPR